MCQGSAAQALATLEALTDTNRRTLLSAAPLPVESGDSELADVYSELFAAAHEIISGLSSVILAAVEVSEKGSGEVDCPSLVMGSMGTS